MVALFFDTETTGVKSWKNPGFIPRLVQLGAILQDLDTKRVLAEINIMVDPEGTPTPQEAANVHGISSELATAYGFPMTQADESFNRLVSVAGLVVAHNIKYDLDVVADNLPKSAQAIKGKTLLCTMQTSRDIVKAPLTAKQVAFFSAHPEKKDGDYKSPNLTEAFKYFFGVEFEGAHDAMADIRACRDIYLELDKRGWQ